jgi:chloride channel 7
VEAASWLMFFLAGVGIGVTAFMIDCIEEFIVDNKWKAAQSMLYEEKFYVGWITYMMIGSSVGACGAALTIWVGPGAAGSGVAELMGYVNGVNYPLFINGWTLFVKVFGVGLAVAGGYKVGKEGPLAHIGANIGVAVVYLPFACTQYFRNDKSKRELIAAGGGAGVSAAFGSPIGGTLFAYEISSLSSFWTFTLMWKAFLMSAMATFILNVLEAIKLGNSLDLSNAGLIKFGKFTGEAFRVSHFPLFAIMGILSGVLGAIFVHVN